MKRNIREQGNMGKGRNSVWGIPLISCSKGRGWAEKGREEKQKAWEGEKRNKNRKLASCFHSWDIQSNEPSFQRR